MCFLFPLHVYLSLFPTLTSALFLSLPLSLFFRLIPSTFLFIIPQVGKFLLLWACPWKASLMRPISWLRPWPLLLLLHKELLPRLPFLHPSQFLLKRVPKPKRLVNPFLFLLRFLLLGRRLLLHMHRKLGVLLLLSLLSSPPTIPLLASPRP